MELTKEQSLVVSTRDKNILVAAAAGSGKTRVLVQRIIEEILDVNHPVDVDRILVVTFTNAAAAEMKERIRKEIEKQLITNPNRADLRRQATLVHNAHIRTIDSFCSWVVKNYFYAIDQDPSFRIGSKGELKLLEDQLLDELIAKRLEERQEDFLLLADAYISGNNVSVLKTMVLDLYKSALSTPWPLEWFKNAGKLYDVKTVFELENSSLLVEALNAAKASCKEFEKRTSLALSLYNPFIDCSDRGVLENENRMYRSLANSATYDEFVSIASNPVFARFSPSKKAVGENAEEVKSLRNSSKEEFISTVGGKFQISMEELFKDITLIGRQVNALIELTRDFYSSYSLTKKKKNLYDFNDIEHMALEILRNKDSEEHEKTAVAQELTSLFHEIMVDEYQDSNSLQEAILTAICKDNNYFTVGDVKQSIYAFRQADPAIFMEKFEGYAQAQTKSIRIDLDKNFRSRGEVLTFCNDVFTPLMQKDMGGVEYDKKAELKIGATGYTGDPKDYQAEVIIGVKDKAEMLMMDIKNSDELEAHIIATKIKAMQKSNYMVSAPDQEHEGQMVLRPMRLNDIVILLRSTSGHADSFLKILRDYDIPAYLESETGFFGRDEISNILAMLEVVDNPDNDLALAQVLHSPLFDFSIEDLGLIRAKKPEGTFYQCIFSYAEEHPENQAVAGFIDLLNRLRFAAIDTPIHDMISLILEETGYKDYVLALPMGAVSVANINKLIDEAVKYEATSAKSITRFVGYINNLKTYEEELGLAKTVGENDVAVRIMTIHKSKGLEFPIVFLARAGGSFKNERGDMFYHPQHGLAMQYKNPKTRLKADNIFAELIKEKLHAEKLGEEQRILYVALTRAKEKLIVVASLEPNSKQTVEDKVESMTATPGQPLDYYSKLSANNYLLWIISALRASQGNYIRTIVECKDLLINEASRRVQQELVMRSLIDLSRSLDSSQAGMVMENIAFTYDRAIESEYKQKYSVSDIKHQAMEKKYQFTEDAAPAFLKKESEPYIPSFMREGEPKESINSIQIPAGALYGTAMHRFCECFDFTEDNIIESFEKQLSFMRQIKTLNEEMAGRINTTKLKRFIESDLAERMHKAAIKGKLYKEQPFVLASNPKELFDDENQADTVTLVQGIIDVFFEEEDGVVLMDYKTDRVDESKDLVLRYEKQLRLYQQAIERGYGVRVKDVLIYSFSLDETISLGGK